MEEEEKVTTEPVRLPQEFKDKWVAALRSGKYDQCTGMLYREDRSDGIHKETGPGYCCLGVAAHMLGIPNDLLANNGLVSETSFASSKLYDEAIAKGYAEALIYDTKGLKGGQIRKFSSMNDDGHTFEEIADYIEQNVIGI